MRQRGMLITVALLAGVLACGIVSGLAIAPDPGRFVVPGASNVHVQRVGWGTRIVSYDFTPTGTAWDTLLDRRLRSARWLPPDFSGAPGQFTIYTYVNMPWIGTTWEEAKLEGDAQHASIILRRWIRLRWLPQYAIAF